MNLITHLRALKRDTAGQDLLEYALLIALIALVAYGAVQLTGDQFGAEHTVYGSGNPIVSSTRGTLKEAP